MDSAEYRVALLGVGGHHPVHPMRAWMEGKAGTGRTHSFPACLLELGQQSSALGLGFMPSVFLVLRLSDSD